MPRNERFDIIIVGAGSAGCLLANRLSADPQVRVLLVEAGPRDRSPLIRLGAGSGRLLTSRHYGWSVQTVPQPNLYGRSVVLPIGRGLGGSSSVNAMAYSRGNPADYEAWKAAGNPSWGWCDVLPAFISVERNEEHGAPLHGRDGELRVSSLPVVNELTRSFIEGCVELGLERNGDLNGIRQDGAGAFQHTVDRGRRWSGVRAFIDPVRGRPNLTVRVDHAVTRLVIEHGRVVGIEVGRPGTAPLLFGADREVIVASGAIHSPKLLLLSGIGPHDELKAIGVEPRHHLPGVGKNFHDHLDIAMVFRGRRPVSFDAPRSVVGKLRDAADFITARHGFYSVPRLQAAAYIRSRAELDAPDLSLHFVPLIRLDQERNHGRGHGFTLHANNLVPTSRGEIRLASADPRQLPLVDPGYMSAPEDHAPMIECVRRAMALVGSSTFGSEVAEVIRPDPWPRDAAGILDFIRRYAGTDYHPAGSCRMGRDPMAVVDDQLRVHGIAGLRVCDASVMPQVIRGNTNAPTMMIAARMAGMIDGRMPAATADSRPVPKDAVAAQQTLVATAPSLAAGGSKVSGTFAGRRTGAA